MFEFLRKLFGTTTPQPEKEVVEPQTVIENNDPDYVSLPAYIPVSAEEKKLVTLVASAIAAGEHPDTKLAVKNIQKKNPEAKKIALAAVSLMAYDSPGKQYRVTSIQKKIS